LNDDPDSLTALDWLLSFIQTGGIANSQAAFALSDRINSGQTWYSQQVYSRQTECLFHSQAGSWNKLMGISPPERCRWICTWDRLLCV